MQAVIYGRLWIFMDMHVMDVYGHFRMLRDIYGVVESYFAGCRIWTFMDIYGHVCYGRLLIFTDIY